MQAFKHDAETRRILAATLHSVPAEPDPLVSSLTASRGTTIVGLMLGDLGDKRGGWKRPGVALSRFGQVAWGLVELAAPRSFGQILFQYWIAVAYALSILMLLVGVLTGSGPVTRAGYLVLGCSVLINIVVEKLRRWMRTGDARQLNPIWFVIPLALAALGSIFPYEHIREIERRIVASGAPEFPAGRRAGELKRPADLARVLAPIQAHERLAAAGSADEKTKIQAAIASTTDANVTRMTASLAWDFLFISCYAVAFLSLGWILATHFDRPYRAFSWVVIATAVTAICDLIENAQALLALRGVNNVPPLYTTEIKLWAGFATMVILVLQTIAVWIENTRNRSTEANVPAGAV